MTEWEGKNLLCFGDNLEFLSDSTLFPDECIDLIYLDPPFNSQQNYNVLFKEASGTPAAAQIKAFEDTWKWDMAANEALTRIHNDPAVPAPLIELMKTFMNFLKASPMMAYLVQMSARLVHMHRVLKSTGSLYLHCDPTASHYLKMVLDAIFGPTSFNNEIIWKRTSAHNDPQRWGCVHDVILFYSKCDTHTWNLVHQVYSEAYLDSKYRHEDERGTYRISDLTAAGATQGDSSKPWRGFSPSPLGQHWAAPRQAIPGIEPKTWDEMSTQDKLDLLDKHEYIYWTPRGKKGGAGFPQYKRYLTGGIPIQDVIADIAPINSQAAERMGYPTQKPIELLKRIVSASSNPGDVVMDPFCGCGTTIDAVETLNREASGGTAFPGCAPKDAEESAQAGKPVPPRTWIGIDITHLSINLIKHRLTRFDPLPVYEVIGEPAGISGAEALAQHDPYQFQFWALGLIGARPVGGTKKKGADLGIDGVRYFLDEMKGKQPVTKTMLVQVKSGKVGSKDIRDFVGTLTRENAEMGVFITLQNPTGPMKAEAATAGTYTSPWDKQTYPKVQILTIEELLKDPYKPNPRCLRVPGGATQHTLPAPARHKPKRGRQGKMFPEEA